MQDIAAVFSIFNVFDMMRCGPDSNLTAGRHKSFTLSGVHSYLPGGCVTIRGWGIKGVLTPLYRMPLDEY